MQGVVGLRWMVGKGYGVGWMGSGCRKGDHWWRGCYNGAESGGGSRARGSRGVGAGGALIMDGGRGREEAYVVREDCGKREHDAGSSQSARRAG